MANGLMERGLKQAEAEHARRRRRVGRTRSRDRDGPAAISPTPSASGRLRRQPRRRRHDDDARRRVGNRRAARATDRRGRRRLEPGHRHARRPDKSGSRAGCSSRSSPRSASPSSRCSSRNWPASPGRSTRVLEGLVLGAISRVYEEAWDGIVLQAVAITVLVLAAMAFLYATRIIKVTERFRRIVIGATLALVVFYVVSMLLSIFGVSVPLIWDAGSVRNPVQHVRVRARGIQPRPRLRPRRARRQVGSPQAVRVVLCVRPDRLPRLALPRGATALGQAPQLVSGRQDRWGDPLAGAVRSHDDHHERRATLCARPGSR